MFYKVPPHLDKHRLPSNPRSTSRMSNHPEILISKTLQERATNHSQDIPLFHLWSHTIKALGRHSIEEGSVFSMESSKTSSHVGQILTGNNMEGTMKPTQISGKHRLLKDVMWTKTHLDMLDLFIARDRVLVDFYEFALAMEVFPRYLRLPVLAAFDKCPVHWPGSSCPWKRSQWWPSTAPTCHDLGNLSCYPI